MTSLGSVTIIRIVFKFVLSVGLDHGFGPRKLGSITHLDGT